MLQYMKHKKHGTHIAYDPAEVETCEKNGWVCVDHPHENPFGNPEPDIEPENSDIESLTLDELRKLADEMGIKVHPAAKEKSIIKKILAK